MELKHHYTAKDQEINFRLLDSFVKEVGKITNTSLGRCNLQVNYGSKSVRVESLEELYLEYDENISEIPTDFNFHIDFSAKDRHSDVGVYIYHYGREVGMSVDEVTKIEAIAIHKNFQETFRFKQKEEVKKPTIVSKEKTKDKSQSMKRDGDWFSMSNPIVWLVFFVLAALIIYILTNYKK